MHSCPLRALVIWLSDCCSRLVVRRTLALESVSPNLRAFYAVADIEMSDAANGKRSRDEKDSEEPPARRKPIIGMSQQWNCDVETPTLISPASAACVGCLQHFRLSFNDDDNRISVDGARCGASARRTRHARGADPLVTIALSTRASGVVSPRLLCSKGGSSTLHYLIVANVQRQENACHGEPDAVSFVPCRLDPGSTLSSPTRIS
jgi:hypothetical protein